jgi:hypothetical protein
LVLATPPARKAPLPGFGRELRPRIDGGTMQNLIELAIALAVGWALVLAVASVIL